MDFFEMGLHVSVTVSSFTVPRRDFKPISKRLGWLKTLSEKWIYCDEVNPDPGLVLNELLESGNGYKLDLEFTTEIYSGPREKIVYFAIWEGNTFVGWEKFRDVELFPGDVLTVNIKR